MGFRAASHRKKRVVLIGEILLVREAGVDRAALRGLHDEGLAEAMSALHAAEAARNAVASSITDALTAEVANAEGPHRGRLVAIRRAVHNNRVLSPSLSVALVTLRPETRALCDEWTSLGTRVAAQRIAVEERLEWAESLEQKHLRNGVADPHFARGLFATSDELAGRAAAWVSDPTASVGHKTAVVLARMLARAGAKTSPFSSWMTTAPTRWGQHPTERTTNGRMVAELDGTTSAQLTACLRKMWETHVDVPLHVNPSVVALESGWLFLRSGPPEQFVRVAEHPAVGAILALLERPLTAAQIREGMPAEDAPWIVRCRSAGLLEPVWPVADLEVRPWCAWADAFVRSGVTTLDPLLRALDTALSRADSVAVAGAVEALAVRVLLPSSTSTVHEVRVADGPRSAAPVSFDDDAVEELDQIRRLLALFDPKLPMKLVASEFLSSEFGDEDVSLVVALEAVQRAQNDPETDLGRIMGPTSPPWGADLGACASGALRSFRDRLATISRSVLDAAADGPLSVTDVRQMIDRSGLDHPNRSATVYVQMVPDADVQRVITVVHGGHGRGRGRFAAQADTLVRDLVHPPNDEVVEICGLLGSTLNARQPTTRRELQYPGAVSARPAEERLAMSELRVHLGALPTLRDREGNVVRPVHLGMAADLALPPLARSIERIFGSAFLLHPSAPPFSPAPPEVSHAPETATPRIVVGRTVVQRARWFLRAEAFPGRTGTAQERLEAWFRWVAERSLKPRFFLRAWGPSALSKQSKARKPVFIDLCSRLLFADAEKLLHTARFAIVEECLPDPLIGEGHVTEYAVQVGDSW